MSEDPKTEEVMNGVMLREKLRKPEQQPAGQHGSDGMPPLRGPTSITASELEGLAREASIKWQDRISRIIPVNEQEWLEADILSVCQKVQRLIGLTKLSKAVGAATTDMHQHELKTWPQFFAKILDGSKPFEIRKDDRGFKVGDELLLREWNPQTGEYTGRELSRVVTYLYPADGYGDGLTHGYCVMGIARAADARRRF